MSNVEYMTFCPMCHKGHVVNMTMDQYIRMETGIEHIQDIFPEKSPNERELLISGTCSDCWDKMFAEEDEEDDWPFDEEEECVPSSTNGDYSPSNPWNAPGMSVSDFI